MAGTAPGPIARFQLQSPRPTGLGAIAAILIRGDVTAALAALDIKPVLPGQLALRSLAGVDTGVVACWSTDAATLMPHAGPAVVAALLDALLRAGLVPLEGDDPLTMYPEAGSLLEARMLCALARAASPLALDLLLQQPERHRAFAGAMPDAADLARSRRLCRLIDPPLVAALGPPNIGKSTLLNTLAGRGVSLVADMQGTTRDHVGANLDLAGLVVRYMDAPGIWRDGARDPIDRAAAELALNAARSADLLLLCGDALNPPIENPFPGVPCLRVALRTDLLPDPGEPAFAADAAVSAKTGAGIENLVAAIREAMVPSADLTNPRPWWFWGDDGAAGWPVAAR